MKQRLSKRDTKGSQIWSSDLGLLRYYSRIIIPDNSALCQEVMKLHYNDPLVGYYSIEKSLELLRRS
jgi:hypothetical protein